jgi:hypothetical protein
LPDFGNNDGLALASAENDVVMELCKGLRHSRGPYPAPLRGASFVYILPRGFTPGGDPTRLRRGKERDGDRLYKSSVRFLNVDTRLA